MVTTYRQQCGYSVGKLKDYIYLIPYDVDLFSYSIDNGQCSEISLNNSPTIYKVEGFNAQMKSEESINGRLKFNSEIDIYIHEPNKRNWYEWMKQMIQNRYYVVVEDMHGTQYVQSVEYYSEFSYEFDVNNNSTASNHIKLVFKGSSNFPTMIMGTPITSTTTLIENQCSFVDGRAYNLQMAIAKYTYAVTEDHNLNHIVVGDNEAFRLIEFMPKSFNFSEKYDSGKFETTLSFTIPLSDYKYYWHYNLVEFIENKYVVTFRTGVDNLYAVGFDNGMESTYTIETSTSVSSINKITITLRYVSDEGLLFSDDSDKDLFQVSEEYLYIPTPTYFNGIITKVCQPDGKAYLTLIERKKNGQSTGEYLCLEGYESLYADLNILRTYSIDDDFGFPLIVDSPLCLGDDTCGTKTDLKDRYQFSKIHREEDVVFTSDCTYSFGNLPSWLKVMKNDNGFRFWVDSNYVPTDDSGAIVIISTPSSTYTTYVEFFVTHVETPTDKRTGWNVLPLTQDTDCEAKTIRLNLDLFYTEYEIVKLFKEHVEVEVSNDLEAYFDGNKYIYVRLPKNDGDEEYHYVVTIKNTYLNEQIKRDIYQMSCAAIEEWRYEGYICESGNKYVQMVKYINGLPTGEITKGRLIEANSPDCSDGYVYRWIETSGYICDNGNEYVLMVQQRSPDGISDWEDTGEEMRGRLREVFSENCPSEHEIEWRYTGEDVCQGKLKCKIYQKYVDGEPTEEYKNRECVTSDTCYETIYRWVDSDATQCIDRGSGICDRFRMSKYQESYDNGRSWHDTGELRPASLLVIDDFSCNCPKHDNYPYERWEWDGEYVCDDEDKNCGVEVLWGQMGFDYNSEQKSGSWVNSTTTIPEACDFVEKITNMTNFAKGCGNLTSIPLLNTANVEFADSAFEGCSKLTSLPVTSFKNLRSARAMFKGCSKITGTVNIDNSYEFLGDIREMFYGCGVENIHFEKQTTALQFFPTNLSDRAKSITGLDLEFVTNDDAINWSNPYLETLEIENYNVNSFYAQNFPSISVESMIYIIQNTYSGRSRVVCYYDQNNLDKWGQDGFNRIKEADTNNVWIFYKKREL